MVAWGRLCDIAGRRPALLGGLALYAVGSVWAMIATAYALAIPNILAGALRNYTDRPGTAGAVLSLLYYNLLGLGLVAAGFGQRLDLVFVACAMCAALVMAIGSLIRR